jgi:hypothetical protein
MSRQVLLRVAEGELAAQHRRVVGLGQRGRVGDLVDVPEVGLDPLAIGVRGRKLALELLVVDDPAFHRVHQEHPSGMQAFLDRDILRREVEHADFRRHHDDVVLGDVVARGAQPVAVQHGADGLAVAEGDGRRTIPGLHH